MTDFEKSPSVFISYSWDSDEHKKKVKELANKLLNSGIEAIIDQYDLQPGDRLPHFMEKISRVDKVLIICTPTYKIKADNRKGGVGYEGNIISSELLTSQNERKFIPLIFEGNIENSLPIFLAGKLYIDFTDLTQNDDNYDDLVTTIYGERKKPPVIKRTSESIKKPSHLIADNTSDEVKILGILTDEVTIPRMDGTRGSALYAIPFKLSKVPSDIWKKLFIATWNYPPRFTTMHRPGIARILGNKIILDGTTIEEVKKYHRDTLVLCVETANKKEKEYNDQKHKAELMRRQAIDNHKRHIEDEAKDIEF